MLKNYLRKGLLVALLTSSVAAKAQYLFKSAAVNGLGPYIQNFDALAGTNATFVSNTTLVGVYARTTFDNPSIPGEYESGVRTYGTVPLSADDGSRGESRDVYGQPDGAAWYHFGAPGSTDRALGGIAATNTSPGIGYVGIRLKNTSGVPIKNLEVQYAMEQWYNSSQTLAAQVSVDYQRSAAAITSLKNGTWTSVPELGVVAPSTSTAIAARDGNAATNRRVLRTTLVGLNLANNEEIMIRWSYVFNTQTNGNGLSIDDVVITPQTNVFYSDLAGDIDKTNSWGTTIGSNGQVGGAKPSNFSAPDQTFYVRGTDGTANRVQQGNAWTVSGQNSKIIVGIPASPAIGSTPAMPAVPATLVVADGNRTVVGTVDVAEGSTLRILRPDATNMTLGALATTSTVEYVGDATIAHTIRPASYGNLVLAGEGSKTLGGDILVNGTLDLGNTAKLTLGAYNVTLTRPDLAADYQGSIRNAGSSAYIVTNGLGALRQTVPNTGLDVLYPIGTATSYTPASLKQSAAQSEDVFAVRVADGTYTQYNANGTGAGTVVAYQNVKKTWHVAEEVAGNSDVTLTLQWNAADATPDFVPAAAHINHYRGGAWDRYISVAPPTTVAPNVYAISRPGITSFSPFGVSSRSPGVLPVQLTSFTAAPVGSVVRCVWQTAAELNNARFVVERSATGQSFQAIGTVAGRGTANTSHHYQFTDATPLAGVNYYRLRQVDTDGTETLSDVAVVTTAGASVAHVTPNPGVSKFRVVVPAGAGSEQGEVLNILGATVAMVGPDGHFELAGQPAGVYLVRVRTPQGVQTARVIKE
ncbi:T9SS type A sorting domain-containing protein [Hymenobacter sp. DG01]|uniref:T9SS type A sorting domain-containing protein n=1 Tax=Hymenobacter sp. DG01 TaxID=2584940 RepID=UPI00111ED6A3|nr:T9SS type A sorting domain-containing protein [Hymenobacter sp. DG01]